MLVLLSFHLLFPLLNSKLLKKLELFYLLLLKWLSQLCISRSSILMYWMNIRSNFPAGGQTELRSLPAVAEFFWRVRLCCTGVFKDRKYVALSLLLTLTPADECAIILSLLYGCLSLPFSLMTDKPLARLKVTVGTLCPFPSASSFTNMHSSWGLLNQG